MNENKTNICGLLATILGIIGFIVCGWLGIIAIVLGFIGLGEDPENKGTSTVGIVLGIVDTIGWIIVLGSL